MKRRLILASILPALVAGQAFGADPSRRPFSISRETTVITAPLRDDGTPDYLAALNEKYGKGVTPENNGFVAWLQVAGTGSNVLPEKSRDVILKMAGARALPADDEYLKVFYQYLETQGIHDDEQIRLDDDFDALRHTLWKAVDHPQAAAFLKAQEKVLDRVVAASDKPDWWMPEASPDDDSMLAVLIPPVGQYRNAANMLAARATLRAAEGDLAGFERDTLAIKRLARLVGRGPALIERLVGIAIDTLADQPLGAVAGTGLLTEAQCARLNDALRNLPPMPSVIESLDVSERWMQLDILVLHITGKGPSLAAGLAPPEAAFSRNLAAVPEGAVNWDIVFRQVNDLADRSITAAKSSTLLAERKATSAIAADLDQWAKQRDQVPFERQPGETRDAYSLRLAHGYSTLMAPTFGSAEELYRRDWLDNQMAQLLLAAAQVKARTGKWPATLRELAPALVKDVPLDLYPVNAPGELKWEVTKDGARVVSLGDNRPVGVGVYLPPASAPVTADGLP